MAMGCEAVIILMAKRKHPESSFIPGYVFAEESYSEASA